MRCDLEVTLRLHARGKRLAAAFALAALAVPAAKLSAQGRGVFGRGGGSGSMSRVVSPAVVASWVSRENYADGSVTTLLVLWRGTPGWFSKGGQGGGSGGGGGFGGGFGGGAGRGGSYGYEYVSEGGLTFMMEFDYDRRTVKILDQEISLKEANVVLVDGVDGANGPAIVGRRWVDPAPQPPSAVDPIAAVVKGTPELFDYLRCDLSVSDPKMNAVMPIICGQMRP